MKKIHLLPLVLFSLLFMVSCKDHPKETAQRTTEIQEDIAGMEQNYVSWWTYQTDNIDLSSDFQGLNTKGEKIDKEEFFKQLNSGDYIPLKAKSGTQTDSYQLYKLRKDANKEISKVIKRVSVHHYNDFKKIGTKFPDFSFKDLQGNIYTNESLKGKTVIIKTWFIHCKACIAEFPELNELVEEFKDRDDIVFISLATDTKEELEKFLMNKELKYKVIPDQKEFIRDSIQFYKYPTHIVIGKDGLYKRIPDDADKLIAYLKNTKVQKRERSGMPPPPPPPPPPVK